MDTLWQDLRYAIRTLRRNPGFTGVAVLTLALGIGANTAIFSVVNAVLLRPLSYKDSERLLMCWQVEPQLSRAPVTGPDYLDWKEQSQVFESIAAGTEGLGRASLTGLGEPEAVRAAPVSAGLFEMLGKKAVYGRVIRPDEDRPGHDAVAVLSYGLWQRRFGSDPGVIGRTITLDGKAREVIGVMPRDFVFPEIWGLKPDIWVPLALARDEKARGQHWLYVLGLLKPHVSLSQAENQMKALAERQAKLFPQSNGDIGARIEPLKEYLVGNLANTLLVLFGVVGFVLLIACANVANLMLVRTSTRVRELAVRASLGASRFRLMRQLLTESVLLSLAGGAAGVILAVWAKDLLISLSPADYFPRAHEINIDTAVLGFTLGMSVLTGIVFGLVPALQPFRTRLSESLKEGGRRLTQSLESRSLRGLLVVAEVAVALVLMIGTGLLIRSLGNLARVNLGFDPENLLTMKVELPESRYSKAEQAIAFYRDALERVQSLPGVSAAAFTSQLPLGGGPNGTIDVEGRPKSTGFGKGPLVQPTSITRDYFRVMSIPLLKGRTFTGTDASGAKEVVIINEALARSFWPDEDPVGRRLSSSGSNQWFEVVGVVGNSRRWSISNEFMPEVYFPYAQNPDSNMKLMVRAAVDPQALTGAIRTQISRVDGNIPVYAVSTMKQIVTESASGRQFITLLMEIFALVAMALAAIGIYGVISYSVARQAHEIGIRMALGAERKSVLLLVLRQGLLMTLIGLAVGIGGAVTLTRVLSSLLFGVSATDPLTFAAVAILLAIVSVLAGWIPARRASRVDPMVALRYE